jgi:sulfide:quinone oxidoreductase
VASHFYFAKPAFTYCSFLIGIDIGGATGTGLPMTKIAHITPEFAVSPALAPDDFARIAAMGFRSVISNLPDGESQAHPTSREASALAKEAGLEYRHIPVIKFDIFSERVVEGVDSALRELPGPVLAHCASGLRSAIAWAAVAARSQPADCVLAKLKAAGLDLETIREDLHAWSGRMQAGQIPPALDAGCGEPERVPA